MSEYNREQTRIQQQLDALRRQSRQDAESYQRELARLREAYEQSAHASNERIRENHMRELQAISARFDSHRAELILTISRQQEEFNRRLDQENQRIHSGMAELESRIEAQLAREQAVADEYRQRVRQEWETLRSSADLAPFIAPHVPTVEQTASSAREAYRLAQYQAVTAIMVNTSALIFCWHQEAQALWEEWQALYELCSTIVDCMRVAMDTAENQQVDCDGKITHVALKRYQEERFAQMQGRIQAHERTLAESRGMSIDEMRAFLHTLQSDQQEQEALIHRAILLHCANIRRLSSMQALTRGMAKREYRREYCKMVDGSLLLGLKVLFRHRYQRSRVLVLITTPEPENGRTEISVTFLPGESMDEKMQHSICTTLSAYVSLLLDQQERRPLHVAAGNAYRDASGLFQSDVTVQYPV